MPVPLQEKASPFPKRVSLFLSPPVLAALTGLIFAFCGDGSPGPDGWRGFAVFCLAAVILPTGYVFAMRRKGRISEVFIPNGRERVRPLLVAAGSCLAGVGALGVSHATGNVKTLLLWYGLFGLLAAAIAGHRHISLHAAGSWGPVVCLLYSYTVFGVVLIPIALLVTWARYALGAHTASQLVEGALAGAGSALATFVVADLLTQLC